jgi:tape measure domain-containing protein
MAIRVEFEPDSSRLESALRKISSKFSGLSDQAATLNKSVAGASNVNIKTTTAKNNLSRLQSMNDALKQKLASPARVSINTTAAQSSLRSIDSQMSSLNNNVMGTVNSLRMMVAALAAVGSGLVAGNALVRASNDMSEFGNRIALVTGRGKEFNRVKDQLFKISADSRTELALVGETFNRIGYSLKDSSYSFDQILEATEAVQKSIVISGGSVESARAAVFQLGQGLSAGALRGQELNSVMEQAPRIIDSLVAKLGVTRGELRGMAEEGLLTTDVVVGAVIDDLPKINKEFSGIQMTAASAGVVFYNELKRSLEVVDLMVGSSKRLTSLLVSASDKLREFNGTREDVLARANNTDNISGLDIALTKVGTLLIKTTSFVDKTLFALSAFGPVLTAIAKRVARLMPIVTLPMLTLADTIEITFLSIAASMGQVFRQVGNQVSATVATATGDRVSAAINSVFRSKNLKDFSERMETLGFEINRAGLRWFNFGNHAQSTLSELSVTLFRAGVYLGLLDQPLIKFTRSGYESFSSVANAVSSFTTSLKSNFFAMSIWATAFTVALTSLRIVENYLVSFGSSLNAAFLRMFSPSIQSARKFKTLMLMEFYQLKNKVSSALSGAFKNDIGRKIKKSLESALVSASKTLTAVLNKVEKVAVSQLKKLVRPFSNFSSKLKSVFYDLYDYIVGNSVWPDMFDEMWDVADSFFSSLLSSLNSFGNSVKSAFENISNGQLIDFSNFYSSFRSVVDYLRQVVKPALADVFSGMGDSSGNVGGVTSKMISAFSGFIRWLRTAISDIFSGNFPAMRDMFDSIVSSAQSIEIEFDFDKTMSRLSDFSNSVASSFSSGFFTAFGNLLEATREISPVIAGAIGGAIGTAILYFVDENVAKSVNKIAGSNLALSAIDVTLNVIGVDLVNSGVLKDVGYFFGRLLASSFDLFVGNSTVLNNIAQQLSSGFSAALYTSLGGLGKMIEGLLTVTGTKPLAELLLFGAGVSVILGKFKQFSGLITGIFVPLTRKEFGKKGAIYQLLFSNSSRAILTALGSVYTLTNLLTGDLTFGASLMNAGLLSLFLLGPGTSFAILKAGLTFVYTRLLAIAGLSLATNPAFTALFTSILSSFKLLNRLSPAMLAGALFSKKFWTKFFGQGQMQNALTALLTIATNMMGKLISAFSFASPIFTVIATAMSSAMATLSTVYAATMARLVATTTTAGAAISGIWTATVLRMQVLTSAMAGPLGLVGKILFGRIGRIALILASIVGLMAGTASASSGMYNEVSSSLGLADLGMLGLMLFGVVGPAGVIRAFTGVMATIRAAVLSLALLGGAAGASGGVISTIMLGTGVTALATITAAVSGIAATIGAILISPITLAIAALAGIGLVVAWLFNRPDEAEKAANSLRETALELQSDIKKTFSKEQLDFKLRFLEGTEQIKLDITSSLEKADFFSGSERELELIAARAESLEAAMDAANQTFMREGAASRMNIVQVERAVKGLQKPLERLGREASEKKAVSAAESARLDIIDALREAGTFTSKQAEEMRLGNEVPFATGNPDLKYLEDALFFVSNLDFSRVDPKNIQEFASGIKEYLAVTEALEGSGSLTSLLFKDQAQFKLLRERKSALEAGLDPSIDQMTSQVNRQLQVEDFEARMAKVLKVIKTVTGDDISEQQLIALGETRFRQLELSLTSMDFQGLFGDIESPIGPLSDEDAAFRVKMADYINSLLDGVGTLDVELDVETSGLTDKVNKELSEAGFSQQFDLAISAQSTAPIRESIVQYQAAINRFNSAFFKSTADRDKALSELVVLRSEVTRAVVESSEGQFNYLDMINERLSTLGSDLSLEFIDMDSIDKAFELLNQLELSVSTFDGSKVDFFNIEEQRRDIFELLASTEQKIQQTLSMVDNAPDISSVLTLSQEAIDQLVEFGSKLAAILALIRSGDISSISLPAERMIGTTAQEQADIAMNGLGNQAAQIKAAISSIISDATGGSSSSKKGAKGGGGEAAKSWMEGFTEGLSGMSMSVDLPVLTNFSMEAINKLTGAMKLYDEAQKKLNSSAATEVELRRSSLKLMQAAQVAAINAINDGSFGGLAASMESAGQGIDASILGKLNEVQSAYVQSIAVQIFELENQRTSMDAGSVAARRATSEIDRLKNQLSSLGSEAADIKESFNSGLQSLMKGESTFREFFSSMLDTITSKIIEKFSTSFTDALFAALDLDSMFTSLFQGVDKVGSMAGNSVASSFTDGVESTASSEMQTGLFGKGGAVSNLFKGFGDLFTSLFGGLFGGGGGGATSAVTAATGGFISGPGTGTSDSIPAMLSNGEFVVNASQTRKYGELLSAINQDKVHGFAMGGAVGTVNPAVMTEMQKSGGRSATQQQTFEINIQGDVSRQTKQEVIRMLPQIASGVNSVNKERGGR